MIKQSKVAFFRLGRWNISPLRTDAMATGLKWSCLTTRSRPFLWSGASCLSWIYLSMNIKIRLYLLDHSSDSTWISLCVWFFKPWPLFDHSWDKEAIQLVQKVIPRETGTLRYLWRATLLNCLSHSINNLPSADIEVDIWDTNVYV